MTKTQRRAGNEEVLDCLEPHVGVFRATKRDAGPRVAGRLDAHVDIVEVHDGGRVVAEHGEQLPLRRRDVVDRVEELEMHGQHVRHEGDIGIGETRQEGDLSRSVHSDLENRGLGIIGA